MGRPGGLEPGPPGRSLFPGCLRTGSGSPFDNDVAACIPYAPEFAFLGFYITRPDLRGHGIGHALWQHVLATSRAQTIGLDGVPDQQDNYRKSGFVLAHRNIRFGGVLPTGCGIQGSFPSNRPIRTRSRITTGHAFRPRGDGSWRAG